MKQQNSTLRQAAFTLLEVLVSLSIFSIVSAAIGVAFVTHLKVNMQQELRSGAFSAAQQVLDELRVQDPSTMPTSGSDAVRTLIVGDRIYSVAVSYCSPATYCTSSHIRSIHVGVTHAGKSQYQVDTVYSQLR